LNLGLDRVGHRELGQKATDRRVLDHRELGQKVTDHRGFEHMEPVPAVEYKAADRRALDRWVGAHKAGTVDRGLDYRGTDCKVVDKAAAKVLEQEPASRWAAEPHRCWHSRGLRLDLETEPEMELEMDLGLELRPNHP
jgi:hypothetical protein